MPYKIGKKTKTKGWPILRFNPSAGSGGKWEVVGHSVTRELAKASIRARGMAAARKRMR
jgi:hypothetical protein